jgi:hypothetical protein
MIDPPHLRCAFAAVCGLACACLATGGVQGAHAGLLHESCICPPATTFDCAPICGWPCEENSGDLPASADASNGDPADEPGASRGGGGGGSNGPMPTTGKTVSFGNEGRFNTNRFRTTTGNGIGGIGAGGGGGGGFSPFFPAGNSTGSSTTGGLSGGVNGGPTTNIPILGTSLSDPITPDPGTHFVFHYTVTPEGPGAASPLFFDPPAYSGYTFQIISGPNFASVEAPIPLPGTGARQFTVIFESYTEALTAGIPFDFTSFDAAGVPQFTITGNFSGDSTVQSRTFDTAITFVGGGDGSFSQTPIESAPEPASLIVWGVGAAALLGIYRKRGTLRSA